MIRLALRQMLKTYAVGACLLRLVQLIDEALDSPAPASSPEPPAPASSGVVVDGELVITEDTFCQCGHPIGDHLTDRPSWPCEPCACPGFALYVDVG